MTISVHANEQEVYEKFKKLVKESNIKIVTKLSQLPIGTMIEIDWHEDNSDNSIPTLFIITKITPELRAPNGELADWCRIEFYCIRKAEYFREYETNMMHWFINQQARIVHVPDNN